MLSRLFAAILLVLASCVSTATPDSVMVGQGIGDKVDGTFLYLNWAIPQPE